MKDDCCSQPGLMALEEARNRLLEAIEPVAGVETVPLECAGGRIVAQALQARMDLPSFDNSAMDGYAIRYQDWQDGKVLKLVGKSFAGAPFTQALPPGCAVRIMTGAAMPAGADTVVMQEWANTEGELLYLRGAITRGDHIRRRGEDTLAGSELVAFGRELGVAHIALAAAAGIDSVVVMRRPRVALFSTGDELRTAGAPLATGAIYDCNRPALKYALHQLQLDVVDLGILADDRAQITRALQSVANDVDVIITSGGVSVGEADYTREVIESLGRLQLWKVAMKPGKPFAFGHIGHTPLFGLPGNPVSALVTFQQLVVPALNRLRGATYRSQPRLRARLTAPLKKSPGREDFQRGIYSRGPQGELEVAAVGNQGSHILSGLADANCFIVLPRLSGNKAEGDPVEITPLELPLA